MQRAALRSLRAATPLALALLLPAGCHSLAGDERAAGLDHRGPVTALAEAGPARFAPTLLREFDTARAVGAVAFAERFYRAPGSEGYEAVGEYVAEELRDAGYGVRDGLELDSFQVPLDAPGWNPERASLVLLTEGNAVTLHAFDSEASKERLLLPQGAPSCDLIAEVAFSLEDDLEGRILATETRMREDLLRRAQEHGAVGVLSASLASYNFDPAEPEAHLDAIQYRVAPLGTELPTFQISPRTYEMLEREHLRRGHATVHMRAEVRTGDAVATTHVATVVGSERPDEFVVLTTHIDQPGAADNASGIAGQLEAARALARGLRSGDLPWPSRSIVFLWGPEVRQSERFLADAEEAGVHVVANVASILTGDSYDRTGAALLLERQPDPGAVTPLAPDEHTAWGASPVTEDELFPTGINAIARAAMHEVARAAPASWATADHPWEGGTDHDEFLFAEIPAVLFWHFAGPTYHTTRDSIDLLDPGELRRTSVAAMTTALCLADPRPEDLAGYLESVDLEEELRIRAARGAGEPELATSWARWSDGARAWLRAQCGEPGAD